MTEESRVSALSPKTAEGKKLLECFKLLAKHTEPKELNRMLPAFMKVTAALRKENEQSEIEAAELRNEAKFLYQLHGMTKSELLQAAELIGGEA